MQTRLCRGLLALIAFTCALWKGAAAASDGACPGAPSVEVGRLGYGTLGTAAHSPDGVHLAVAGSAGVAIWNTQTGTAERFLLVPDEAYVLSVAWSPDGTRLASRSWAGSVEVWSPEDGQLVRTLAGPDRRRYSAVAWKPGGCYLASGSDDGIVRLWGPPP